MFRSNVAQKRSGEYGNIENSPNLKKLHEDCATSRLIWQVNGDPTYP